MEQTAAPDDEQTTRKTRTSKLRDAFALFDQNHDGVLTKDEIIKGLTRPTKDGTRTFNVKMLNEFFLFLQFDKIDVNSDGGNERRGSNIGLLVSETLVSVVSCSCAAACTLRPAHRSSSRVHSDFD